MNNEIRIPVRRFPLIVKDERTGRAEQDSIVLTKEQLQACQIVGMSATELIYSIYNRQGYRVLAIGKPVKKEIRVDIFFDTRNGSVIVEGEGTVLQMTGGDVRDELG